MIPIVVDDLGVVSTFVAWDVGLGYFYAGVASEDDVGDFGYGALGFWFGARPSGEGAVVGEFGDGVGGRDGEEPEGECQGLDKHARGYAKRREEASYSFPNVVELVEVDPGME